MLRNKWKKKTDSVLATFFVLKFKGGYQKHEHFLNDSMEIYFLCNICKKEISIVFLFYWIQKPGGALNKFLLIMYKLIDSD